MTIDRTRRNLLQGVVAASGLAAAGVTLPSRAFGQALKGTGQVVVYNAGGVWGDAKRLALFEPFERDTGIKVVSQPRTDTGAVRASVLAGSPRYDVTILPGGKVASFERENLLMPMDFQHFDKKDLDAYTTVAPTKFMTPAILYSVLMAYDATKFGTDPPKTWADLLNTGKFKGGRTLMGGTWGPDGATFEIALMADGVSPDKLYPIDWDRAFKSLDKLKPDIIKWWNNGAEAPQLLLDREVSMASAWNGRVIAAIEQGAKIGYTYNQGILQYDSWVILKGTKNYENATKFLAYASRPEVQANFVKYILYAPPNARAMPLIPAERAKLLPTAPDVKNVQFVQNYAFWNAIGPTGKTNSELAVTQWERWLAGAR